MKRYIGHDDFYSLQFSLLNRVFKNKIIKPIWQNILDSGTEIDRNIRPIFVVGCGHSGTSILTSILHAHPNLFALSGETYIFRPWWRRNRIGQVFHKKIDGVEAARPVEKTPRHVHEIARIKSFYPKARFIAVVRDGRDVVASIKKRTGRISGAMKRFVYDNGAVLAVHDKPWVHVVRYEDIVRNPEETIKGILDFLEEPYHPLHQTYLSTPRDWYAKSATASPHSLRRAAQVNTPLYDGSGSYKSVLSAAELSMFEAQCGKIQIALGYSLG